MSSPSLFSATASRYQPWLRRIAYALVALVLLAIAIWLAIPPIARAQLESKLGAALGRPTTVESVAFDPFALRLTVRNLAIADRAGPRPLLALEELIADFSSASIWHRAPVLDSLKLVRPKVSLSRDAEGRYNIDDLIEQALKPGSGDPARLSLNNIEIKGGSIAFDDGATGRKHDITSLD